MAEMLSSMKEIRVGLTPTSIEHTVKLLRQPAVSKPKTEYSTIDFQQRINMQVISHLLIFKIRTRIKDKVSLRFPCL